MRQKLPTDDVTGLQQANGRLDVLLSKEADFQAFLDERSTARRIAGLNATTTAKAEIERIETFIRQYVAENILDDHVDDLLKLQEDLSAARSSDDADRIVRAQKDGREKITSFGLGSDLDRFELPAPARRDEDKVEAAQNGLAVTPLNEKLLGPVSL